MRWEWEGGGLAPVEAAPHGGEGDGQPRTERGQGAGNVTRAPGSPDAPSAERERADPRRRTRRARGR